jgi:hypothetical protein
MRTRGVVANGGLLVEAIQLEEGVIAGPLGKSLDLVGSLLEVLLEGHCS